MTALAQEGSAVSMPATSGVSAWQVIRQEAWAELRAGLGSGVVALIFVGLTAYLLLVLTSAGYLRELNAVDIPRNAPSLVYLMTSGDAFFLLFAWAWVFAQPVVRDRQAQLHELVLAAPVPLHGLLLGRYLGAVAVAALLGASQMAGFLLAPVLEWVGAVPAGAMGATPWAALGWAWLVFSLPSALGCGAIYMAAALRTRSLVGPFAAASVLMLCWMLAMIVLKEGRMDPFLSTVLDPSGFAEAETQVLQWTPQQKSTALLALSPALQLNRLLWCALPLLGLAWVLWRVTRESLVLERAPRQRKAVKGAIAPAAANAPLPPVAVTRIAWVRAAWAEALWQCRMALRGKGLWYSAIGLVLVGVAGCFVHGVGHADGPMVPRPEFLSPVGLKMMFLLIASVVAAVVGLVWRRDSAPGFGEMLDATPAPDAVRLIGRASAVLAVTILFALVPGVSGAIVVALAGPAGSDVLLPVVYQLVLLLPALLEMAGVMVLMHALIRPAGPAYAASLLMAFIFIVNHEADLISYPPAEVAIPLHIQLSPLTGWSPWLERLAVGDVWKLALAGLLLALAGVLLLRGTDGRWRVAGRQAARRLWGPIGAAALLCALALGALVPLQQQRLVQQGGYRSTDEQVTDDAQWEKRWLGRAGAWTVAGGEIDIDVDASAATVAGRWQLKQVRVERGWLHLSLPPGLSALRAQVAGGDVVIEHEGDHAAADLQSCAIAPCEVTLSWQVANPGWDAEGRPPWLSRRGMWARAADLAPRLGIDRERLLRSPADRRLQGLPVEVPVIAALHATSAMGIAPAGDWRWMVRHHAAIGGPANESTGSSKGNALDFAAIQAPAAQTTKIDGRAYLHDATHRQTADEVAEDLQLVSACVARRVGAVPEVRSVVQMPRGLDQAGLAGMQLLLPEQPAWDVAATGLGRHLRRADIAAALARTQLAGAAQLRGGDGALWMTEGLAGAIGLLCAGDAGGLDAVSALLDRGADVTSQALAASRAPVGDVTSAPGKSWFAAYGQLALLGWAGQRTGTDIQALVAAVRDNGGDVVGAVRHLFPEEAEALSGAALASDLRLSAPATLAPRSAVTEQWRWERGGWAAEPARARRGLLLVRHDAPSGALRVVTLDDLSGVAEGALVLDARPGFERAPKDNRLGLLQRTATSNTP